VRDHPIQTTEPPEFEEAPPQPPPPRRRKRLRWLPWLVLLLIAVGVKVYFLWLAAPAPHHTAAVAPIGVVAARAHLGSISVLINGLGTVVPVTTVNVTSRVDGELVSVLYKQGDIVQRGQLLAQIDPRPYEAQLLQYQGQLARDEAALANAQLDLTRYASLLPDNAIPRQTYDTQKSLVQQDEGVIKADEGLIQSAQVNIAYTKIAAPLSGQIGLRLVDPGNVVSANSTVLAVITQISPTTVVFTISEQQLPQVRARFATGTPLPAYAYDSSFNNLLGTGRLQTIDNVIDPTTGTVRLRAIFPNSHDTLYPNQFVNVQLLLNRRRNVVLVPNAAIQLNGTEAYVWVVQPDNTVNTHPVTVGASGPQESQITSGVAAGQLVVTQGVDRLHPGSKVNAQVSSTSATGAGASVHGTPAPGTGAPGAGVASAQ
jgi:multidrug efflux system membrane fusion protein